MKVKSNVIGSMNLFVFFSNSPVPPNIFENFSSFSEITEISLHFSLLKRNEKISMSSTRINGKIWKRKSMNE
jgi:hypothetical protein